jgi:hypothetical protein
MVTGHDDFRVCLDALVGLVKRDSQPDVAVELLEPLLAEPGCRCLAEAAFLLGVARLAQSQPEGLRRRAAAEAFAIAAEQENAVYAPAAAYRYATLLHSTDGAATRAAWQRVADTSRRAYSPVAHFMIGNSLRQEGLDAEEPMMRAFLSCDAEYAPKAAVWLLRQHARAGGSTCSEDDEVITGMINEFRPLFVYSDFDYRQWLLPLWRRQLLDHSSPLGVLRATHALAQLDGATDFPTLGTMLRDHIRALDGAEAQNNGKQPAKPGFDADATERPPWWIGTVADHQDQGTLVELAHELFWVISQIYTHPALAYAEGTVEQPEDLVRKIVHTMDDFSWGPLLHEDFRQRINLVLQEEVLPPGWPDLHHTEVLPPG